MEKDYKKMIEEVLTSTKSIKEVANENKVYISTLSKRVQQFLNIQKIEDVIYWCDIVDDTRKVISSKNKKQTWLWEKIHEQTSFLPSSSGIRERLWYIKNKTNVPPLCSCGGPLNWNTSTQNGFNSFCSITCTENINQANEKRKLTNLKTRGVEYCYNDVSVRNKRNATMIERYGSTSFNKSKVPQHSLDTLNDKDKLFNLYESCSSTFEIAKVLGVSQSYVSQCMSKLGILPSKHNSNFEQNIQQFITSLDIEYIKTRKIIPPQEIDIFIPSHDVGIECNGVYWHSEYYKPKNYHKEKMERCKQQNIRLIQIFENEYNNFPEIVKSRISSILGENRTIGARQCKIKEVDYEQSKKFFERTHIQQSCPSSINIGLFYNDNLVACMSFGKSRFNKNYEYELLRYSNELYTTVMGGASKIFKHFIEKYKPHSIISYSDNRWNTGKLYQTLGFNFSHVSSPNYFYFQVGDVNRLFSRVMFQKHKLKNKLKEYDEQKTEYENMKQNGYERIWDCGNTVWTFNL